MKDEKKLDQLNSIPGGQNRKRLDGGGRKISHPDLDKELADWVKEMRTKGLDFLREMRANARAEDHSQIMIGEAKSLLLAAHCGQCFTRNRQVASPEHSQPHGQEHVTGHYDIEQHQQPQVQELVTATEEEGNITSGIFKLTQVLLSHYFPPKWSWFNPSLQITLPVETRSHPGEASTSQITTEQSTPPNQESPIDEDLYPPSIPGSPIHGSPSASPHYSSFKSPLRSPPGHVDEEENEVIKMHYIDYYQMKRKSHFKILISRGDGCTLVKDLNESIYQASYYDPTYIHFNNSVLLKEILLHNKKRDYNHLQPTIEGYARGIGEYDRIMSLISHKNSTEKLTLLIENSTQTVENYFVHNMEKSPSKVMALVLQMALAVEQYHNFGVHLSIDHSHFFCVKISDNEPCYVKLLPATHSILKNVYNEGQIFYLTESRGFDTYKSLEYKKQNNEGRYEVSRASDVYSLCLLALEFTLRSDSQHLGVNDSFRNVNSEQLLAKGHTAILYKIFKINPMYENDQAETENWNDLMKLFSGCLVDPQNRPTIRDVVTQLGHQSTL
uniref:Protein kinase domain-containing protein n=2 Tax=Meloidogyne TaxID=189290 RepID=A0A915P8A1_9BILA